MATYRIPVVRSASVRSEQPGVAFNGGASMEVGYRAVMSRYGSTVEKYADNAYIGFDAVNSFGKKEIASAKFCYTVLSSDFYAYGWLTGITVVAALGVIDGDWDEKVTNYQNQPKYTVIGQLSGQDGMSGGEHGHMIPSEQIGKVLEHGLAFDMTLSGWRYNNQYMYNVGQAWRYYTLAGYGAATGYPYLEIEAVDAVPAVEAPTPSSGYVDERKTNRFSWTFAVSAATLVVPTQASGTFRWRIAGETAYKTISIGANPYVDVPAGTFPAQSGIEWQARVVSDDGVTGAWTPWYRLTTIDSAAASTAIRPSGQYLDRMRPTDFTWRHASPTGTMQTRAELQIKYGAGAWQALATVIGETQSYTLPAETMPGGLMAWRVRTYNGQGKAGEWSPPLENTVVASPGAPNVNRIDPARARPTITWQRGDQTAYELRILQAGRPLVDTGIVLNVERAHKLVEYLPNGTYTVQIRASNEYAYWSDWGEATWTVAAPKPDVPAVFAAPVRYGVRVVHDAVPYSIVRVLLYRKDGARLVPIADLPPGQLHYTDYASAGPCDYVLRVIDAADNFADAPPIRARAEIPCAVLALASDPGRVLEMRYRLGSPVAISRTLTLEATAAQFDGRPLPVFEFGPGKQRSRAFSFSLRTAEEYDMLLQLMEARETMIYRDNRGQRAFCVILSMDDQPGSKCIDVHLSLTDVDYEEAIPLA